MYGVHFDVLKSYVGRQHVIVGESLIARDWIGSSKRGSKNGNGWAPMRLQEARPDPAPATSGAKEGIMSDSGQ